MYNVTTLFVSKAPISPRSYHTRIPSKLVRRQYMFDWMEAQLHQPQALRLTVACAEAQVFCNRTNEIVRPAFQSRFSGKSVVSVRKLIQSLTITMVRLANIRGQRVSVTSIVLAVLLRTDCTSFQISKWWNKMLHSIFRVVFCILDYWSGATSGTLFFQKETIVIIDS